MTPYSYAPSITLVACKLFQSQNARVAAGFAALAVLLVLTVGCSDAPLVTGQANRLVLSEIFSTTE